MVNSSGIPYENQKKLYQYYKNQLAQSNTVTQPKQQPTPKIEQPKKVEPSPPQPKEIPLKIP